jgi:hypothetical protein
MVEVAYPEPVDVKEFISVCAGRIVENNKKKKNDKIGFIIEI